MPRTRYEFSDGSSNKFWEMDLNGSSFKVTFGKIGTSGQTQLKEFKSDADAKKEADKLIAEKTKKGYALVGGGGSAKAAAPAAKPAKAAKPADDDDDDDDDDDADDDDDDAPPAKPAKAAAGGGAQRYEMESKFWEIKLSGSSFTVTFGKQGTAGQTQLKEFDSPAEAKKEHDKLVAEKTKKGYEPVAGGGAAPAKATAPAKPAKAAKPADDDDEEEEDDDDDDDDEKPAKTAKGAKAAPAAAPAKSKGAKRYEMESKFWQIDLSGSSFKVTFGKQGTNGQTQLKEYGSPAEAKKEHDKLVAEKTKKGYELVED